MSSGQTIAPAPRHLFFMTGIKTACAQHLDPSPAPGGAVVAHDNEVFHVITGCASCG